MQDMRLDQRTALFATSKTLWW